MTRPIVIRAAFVAAALIVFTIGLAVGRGAPSLAPPSPSPTTSSPTSAPSASSRDALPDVDGARALQHIAFFADRAQGGRFTASPGYEASTRYMADRFGEIGLEPWGDNGTFFEHFRMPIVDLAATPVLARTTPDAKTYRHRVDFAERVGGSYGSGSADAPLVFIGSGVTTPGASDFEKVDVRGKIAMVITAGRTDPARELATRGAAGAIYVTSGSLLKFSYIARFESVTIPSIVVTTRTADELLAPSGKTVSDLVTAIQTQTRGASASPPAPSPAFELAERLRLSVPLTPLREVDTVNVVGLLRGSDPNDAKQAVLVGGHLDGVGTDPDGTVFTAANDNASGPAVTIEVARALAGRRSELRHSVIFVAWAGEEEGLNGSEAFATQMAALPGRRESLLGYVNLDVVGCCGETIAASTESSTMVDRVRAATERLGVAFGRGGGSSDQTSFTRRNVPATLLDWTDNGPIHTTTDTIDKITPEHLRTIGRVAALVALDLASGR